MRYLHSQKKRNSRHARWVEFINEYSFVLKHRSGVENKVADALSRVLTALQMMSAQVIGFDRMKDEYSTCPDFGLIYQEVRDGNRRDYVDFVIREGQGLAQAVVL